MSGGSNSGGMTGEKAELRRRYSSSPSVWKMTMGRWSSAPNASRSVAISALYWALRPKRRPPKKPGPAAAFLASESSRFLSFSLSCVKSWSTSTSSVTTAIRSVGPRPSTSVFAASTLVLMKGNWLPL